MPHGLCPICGIPADAEFFDDANFVDVPEKGGQVVLAQFQLPQQYCGVLENFAQFTNLHAIQNEQIATPGLEWIILRNGQPLFPYIKFELIVNPWGFNNYPVAIRLEENAKVEFVLRNRSFDQSSGMIEKVAGRIGGRYWYNRVYGGNGKAAGCEVYQPGASGFWQ